MSHLQKYKPFTDLWNLEDEVGRLFWGLTKAGEEVETQHSWLPAVDIKENDKAILIHADLPGVKKEDIKVNYQDGILTLQGERKFEEEKKKENYYRFERRYGKFARSFSLPNTVDPERIKANMQDGVLELSIEKKPEAKAREIQING